MISLLLAPTIPTLFYLFTTNEHTIWLVFAGFQVPIGGIPATLGVGLRRLRNWARMVTASILGVVFASLVIIGVFAIINITNYRELINIKICIIYFVCGAFACALLATCLLVLVSKPAAIVCHPSYRSAVALTPRIRLPLSLVWKVVIAEGVVSVPLIGLAYYFAQVGRI